MKVIKTIANEFYLIDGTIKANKGEIVMDTKNTYHFFIESKPNEKDNTKMEIVYSYSRCSGYPLFLKEMTIKEDAILYIGDIDDNSEPIIGFKNFKANVRE